VDSVDFLFVLLTEHFSLGFPLRRYEQILTGNRRSSGRPPRTIFARIYASECVTTLSLTVFTKRNFVAEFLQQKCNFTRKTAVLEIEGERSPPTNCSPCQKTRMNALSCDIRMWAQVSFVLSQSTRLMDRV